MSGTEWSTSYDDLLRVFKRALVHALRTGQLSPECADFDVALIYAIGDVARAARDGSRTGELVREACRAFGQFVVQQDGFGGTAQHATQGKPDRSETA